jgi:hypothetical protein
MAYVTMLKKGEGLKIGDSVMVFEGTRTAKVVLEVDDNVVIRKLTKEQLRNERFRKKPILSDEKEKEKR